jgi:hypothetical protein
VFELEMEVPKYVMYAAEAQPPAAGPPASCVSCVLQHPMSRLQGWVETRFSTKTCISSSASRCVFQLGNLAAGVAIISGLGQQTGLCRVCRSPILQLIGSSYLSLINYIIN